MGTRLLFTHPSGAGAIDLPLQRASIGSGEGNLLRINDVRISNEHLQLWCTSHGWAAIAKGPAMKNGEAMVPGAAVALEHGDWLLVGALSLWLIIPEEPGRFAKRLQRMEELERTLKARDNELAGAQRGVKKALEGLQTRHEELQTKERTQRSELDLLLEREKALVRREAAWRDDLEAVRAKRVEAEKQRDDCQKKLEQSEARIAWLQKSAERIEQLELELEEARRRKEEFRQRAAHAEQLQERAERAEGELQKEQSRRSESESRLVEQQEELTQEKARTARLVNARDGLEKRVKEEKDQHKVALDLRQQQITSLEKDKKEVEAEREDLRTKYQAAKDLLAEYQQRQSERLISHRQQADDLAKEWEKERTRLQDELKETVKLNVEANGRVAKLLEERAAPVPTVPSPALLQLHAEVERLQERLTPLARQLRDLLFAVGQRDGSLQQELDSIHGLTLGIADRVKTILALP